MTTPTPPADSPKSPVASKRTLALIAAALVITGLVWAIATFVNRDAEKSDRSGAQATSGSPGPDKSALAVVTTSPRPKASIGKPLRDGTVEFNLRGFDCGIADVRSGALKATPKGHYCAATITVRNLGKKPLTIDTAASRAFESSGSAYAPDVGATDLHNTPKTRAFLKPIPVNGKVTGTVLYDVPKKASITRLDLYAGSRSNGVTFALR